MSGMKFLTIPPKSAVDEQWTTKDGQKIAVCDMSENHAKNALRMMIRQAKELKLAQVVESHDWWPLPDDLGDQDDGT